MSTNDIFEGALQMMSDIHNKKSSDYGNSFDDTCNKFGIVAALVRMYDKLNRVSNLSKREDGPKVDESIEDTLIDLANYAILTYCWLINNKKHEQDKQIRQFIR